MSDDQPDEGSANPSATDSRGRDLGDVDTADPSAGDDHSHDPAGVGDRPEGDPTGLSGQPDADEFESATDWSDVDDTGESPSVPDGTADTPPSVDAGTKGSATNTGPRDDVTGPSNVARGNQSGPPGEGKAGAGGAPAGRGADGTRRGPAEKFCSNCGSVINEQAVVCPDCGVEQANVPQGGRSQGGANGNDPAVAALLSAIGFLFPLATGAGQIYNGQVGKGVLFTVVQLINVGLVFVLIGIVTYPVVGIIAIWDAYVNADG